MLNLAIIGKFAGVLLFVVALILLTGRILRTTHFQKQSGRWFAPERPRHLKLLEVLPVDFKRKLVLIEHGGEQHLLLCGPERDIIIQSKPSTATAPSADTVMPVAALY